VSGNFGAKKVYKVKNKMQKSCVIRLNYTAFCLKIKTF